ncbi:hypothetical protein ASC97_18955 [Rhizobium sp. Root1203]|nr:hypothetical protein ASC97_18955 [Rhizobium sp. Root1203]
MTGVLYKMKGAGGNNLNKFGWIQTIELTMECDLIAAVRRPQLIRASPTTREMCRDGENLAIA